MEVRLKDIENKCSCKERKPIKAYCGKCHMYLCTDCHMFKHLDHDTEVIDLASKCTKFLVDYQRLSRTASLLEDRRVMHIQNESIDKIAEDLKKKMMYAKDRLLDDINRLTESSLQYMSESPLIQELIRKKSKLSCKGEEALQKIKEEMENTCKSLVQLMSEDKFQSADALINNDKLKKYEELFEKIKAESGEEAAILQELKKLKQTSIIYSYNPLTTLGLIKVDTEVKKSNRVLQFDRAQNHFNIFSCESNKMLHTLLNPGFILPFRFISIEIDHNVYLSGGDNDHGHFLNSTFLTDELRGTLLPLASMHDARSSHALAAFGTKGFFAIGGEGKDGPLTSTEYYDIVENIWIRCANLNAPRSCHSACVFGGKTIYVFGGWNGYTHYSVERLDMIGKKQWEIVRPQRQLRQLQLPGAVQIRDNEILIFGGYSESEELCSECVIFNCKTNEVTKCTSLPGDEAFISSEIKKVDNNVYSFGYDHGGVYIFDIEKKEWLHIQQNNLSY